MRAVDDYVRELKASLAGLPRPDVDDIAEEVRSHLAEQVADGRSPAEALQAFGDAETVARDVVERRLRPEDGEPVPPAPLAPRAMALAADFVIAWGALLVLPVWPALVMWWQDRFQISAEQIAALTAEFGYERATFPWGWLAAAVALAAWGVWYWRGPRARSTSVGMRMAGLSRFRLGGETVVVRSAGVSESEPARIVSRTKWYLALPLALLGAIVALVTFEYAMMTLGSIDQPSGKSIEAAEQYEDFSRADRVLAAFYDEVVAGDVPGAQALAEEPLASQVASLVAEARARGIVRAERGMNAGVDAWVMHETYRDGSPPRTVVVRLARHEEQRDAATFTTFYRVSSLETSATAP